MTGDRPAAAITLHIADDGTVTLRVTDASVEEQGWAVQPRNVDVTTLRNVAALLGPDVAGAVEARLHLAVDRQRQAADRLDNLVTQAREARQRLFILEAILGRADTPKGSRAR